MTWYCWVPGFVDGNARKDSNDVDTYAPAYDEWPHIPENHAMCINTPEGANIEKEHREPDHSKACIVQDKIDHEQLC